MPDRLANYVPVAERLTQAQSEIIAVDADPPAMLNDAMGYIRVAVYLSDGRKATGTASFRLDLTGKSAQATNPIEDCETSALGRALGMLGYSSNKSIASREEVKEAQRRAGQNGNGASYKAPPEEVELTTVVAAREFKITPDGTAWLKLTLGDDGQIALMRGAEAEAFKEIAKGASIKIRAVPSQHKTLGDFLDVRDLRPVAHQTEETELPSF
jgi:hypothetical protein